MSETPKTFKSQRSKPGDNGDDPGLGHPDVYPAEEFAGIGELGEFPEFLPTDERLRAPKEPSEPPQ